MTNQGLLTINTGQATFHLQLTDKCDPKGVGHLLLAAGIGSSSDRDPGAIASALIQVGAEKPTEKNLRPDTVRLLTDAEPENRFRFIYELRSETEALVIRAIDASGKHKNGSRILFGGPLDQFFTTFNASLQALTRRWIVEVISAEGDIYHRLFTAKPEDAERLRAIVRGLAKHKKLREGTVASVAEFATYYSVSDLLKQLRGLVGGAAVKEAISVLKVRNASIK